MGAVIYEDINIDQGCDYPGPGDDVAQWEWRTVSSTGPLVDLTGYTASMKIRASADSTAVLLTLSSGSGITLGGALGTIAIAISDTDTLTLPVGTLYYDLVLTSGSGLKYKFAQGAVIVRPTSSR